jgi:GrpB-like predicted nucleotidyltransferase (UPF0157 family)
MIDKKMEKKSNKKRVTPKIIGLKQDTIELINYNPEWKKLFKLEKNKLLKILGKKILSVEHIGSTAIEYIRSKPIIDICIGLKNFNDGFECVEPLSKAGYLFKGEFGILGRHYFMTNNEIVKFHIHMYEIESENYKNHLRFRDYLIDDKESAKKYEELKLKLKLKYKDNRQKYTEGKTHFIRKIIKKAIKKELA